MALFIVEKRKVHVRKIGHKGDKMFYYSQLFFNIYTSGTDKLLQFTWSTALSVIRQSPQ